MIDNYVLFLSDFQYIRYTAQQLMDEMNRAEAAERARLNPVFPKEGWWTQPAVRFCVFVRSCLLFVFVAIFPLVSSRL